MKQKILPGRILVHTIREVILRNGSTKTHDLYPAHEVSIGEAITVLAQSELRLGGDVECILSDELVTTNCIGDARDRTFFQGNQEDMLALTQLAQTWLLSGKKDFFRLIAHT